MIFEHLSSWSEHQRKNSSGASRWNVYANSQKAIRRMLLLILLVPLAACFKEETVAVSMEANNYTDKSIISILINGEGGILSASAHGQGGGVCCVVLPEKWRPGLRAKIEWQYDSVPQLDSHGKVMIHDGREVLIESPWNERTIELPKYDRAGAFQLHFYPNGDVKSVISDFFPGHAQYPEPQ